VYWCSVESASSGWTDVILLLLLRNAPSLALGAQPVLLDRVGIFKR
jgi:hypothetical protein